MVDTLVDGALCMDEMFLRLQPEGSHSNLLVRVALTWDCRISLLSMPYSAVFLIASGYCALLLLK